MVRFIIKKEVSKNLKDKSIYIPIWLDLLFHVSPNPLENL